MDRDGECNSETEGDFCKFRHVRGDAVTCDYYDRIVVESKAVAIHLPDDSSLLLIAKEAP